MLREIAVLCHQLETGLDRAVREQLVLPTPACPASAYQVRLHEYDVNLLCKVITTVFVVSTFVQRLTGWLPPTRLGFMNMT